MLAGFGSSETEGLLSREPTENVRARNHIPDRRRSSDRRFRQEGLPERHSLSKAHERNKRARVLVVPECSGAGYSGRPRKEASTRASLSALFSAAVLRSEILTLNIPNPVPEFSNAIR